MGKTSTKFNIMAIILIIIFCFAITPITLQNDTYYTVKIGEYIMQNGITGIDPFSWHEGLKYTFPHWGYDVIMYQIYNLGGFEGIYISTIFFSCLLGTCIYLINIKLNKNKVLSFFVTLGVIYLLRDYIAARAQLVTFILFILEIYSIEMFLKTKSKRYGIYLLLLSIAIANLHVAVWPFFFVLFMPYIGEYVLCLIADIPKFVLKMKRKRLENIINNNQDNEELKQKLAKIEGNIEKHELRKEKNKEETYKVTAYKNSATKWLIIILIICIFTGFLTPLGTTPYTYLAKTMQGNTTKNINEHLPLTLYNNLEFMMVIVVFLSILTFTDTKISLKDLLMIGGLLFLSFMSRRQTSMFILIGNTVLIRLIQAFLNKYDKILTDKAEHAMTTMIGKIVTCAIVLFISFNTLKPKVDDKIVNDSSYPVEASNYILENLDVQNIKLYNEYNYGSYLLYRGIPVFIDSRADLYSPEFNEGVDTFSDFLNISNIGTYYEDKFREYGITHAIVYKNAKLNMFLSRDENYKQLYSDDNFCIYERLKGK